MALSYKARVGDAWRKAGSGSKEYPGEIFPQITQKDFDELKRQYNEQYGYTIRIPQFDDVIHLTPNSMKTEAELKAEKKANLIRILEAPSTEFTRTVSSVVTWTDNQQDTASVVIPLMKLALTIAPKAFGKLLPILGWITAGYDILDMITKLGQAMLMPMTGKRSLCKFTKFNPFTKEAQWQRTNRIKNWKLNLADFIQAAQVSDQYLGVGLSLGGIMGAITMLPYGAYHYLNGDKVRFAFDAPNIENLQKLGAKGIRNAALISAQGQIFDEGTHLYTYITGALSTMLLAGPFREWDMAGMVEDPMNVMIPADRPTDPITIAVIKEMGIDLEATIGWPWNGKKEISLGDLIDATHEPIRSNFFDYAMRHKNDWMGWLAAWAMDYIAPHAIGAIDPDAKQRVDDTPDMKVLWKMIKAPLLTDQMATDDQKRQFYDWIVTYKDLYGKEPGLMEIEQKLNSLGIKTKNQYPDKEPTDGSAWWPIGWRGDET